MRSPLAELLRLPGFDEHTELPPCTRTDPEQFFPDPADREAVIAASRICAGCPFIDPCLAYGITHDVEGVWGGRTREQRRRLARQQGNRPRPLSTVAYLHSYSAEAVERRRQRKRAAS